MNIGERMKNYEKVYSHSLTKRSPIIVRVDGRHFHTFARHANKPFDINIIRAMIGSALYVAQDMQSFKAAFIQSDEASFLITDYDDINTQGWFNYKLNKIVSISASRMSVKFNNIYKKSSNLAEFDSRAFVVPIDDISNYFLWRAKDWYRNSMQMFARAHFSHKQLYKKNLTDIHNLLHKKGLNWSNLSLVEKNGTWIDKNFNIHHDIFPSFESINKFIANQDERIEDYSFIFE